MCKNDNLPQWAKTNKPDNEIINDNDDNYNDDD